MWKMSLGVGATALLLTSCLLVVIPDSSTLDPVVLTGQEGQQILQTVSLPARSTAVTYDLASKPAWLTLTPTTVRSTRGEAVNLSAEATCDQPQTLSGQVLIHASTAPYEVTVPVVLVCTATTAPSASPDPFSFPPVEGAAPGGVIVSDAVTLSGLAAESQVSVQGGTLLLNGEIKAAPQTVTNGDRLQLQVQASLTPGAVVAAVATVGQVSGVFLVTTAPAVPVAGPLTATPARLDLTGTGPANAQLLTVTRARSDEPITVTSSCGAAASVTPTSGTAPTATFQVTPLQAGSCALTFQSGDQLLNVPITVTTTTVGVN